MIRPAQWILALGLVAAAPRALIAQTALLDPRVSSYAGCYTVSRVRWSAGVDAARVSKAQTPPSTFRLDTLTVAARGGTGSVVIPTNLVASTRTLTAWQPLPNDSVRVVWSTGFVGVVLRLGARGDTLAGHATTFHDDISTDDPPNPSAEIIAIRVR
ncbi:hypothetical protein [Gemmatimonas groenlandica]|uniref:Uncharacterized protein n=1 Tax=Gemmatimonas groenlandica TaxID=2732249 RepID=A0A6M4IY42_9BACT|nr:hypothetical protein [Gemmatimonas groenlandica]QJR37151.1 hypothetical protein HKW67_17320 [Gemmatimonas groenlandica]